MLSNIPKQIISSLNALVESVDVSDTIKDLHNWRNEVTGKGLATEDITKLTKAAEILEVLENLKSVQKQTSKTAMLKGIGAKTMKDVYDAIYSMIETDKLPLPKSRRIETKLNEYNQKGISALISKKRTSRNNLKIEGNNKKYLNYLLSHPNRLNTRQIAQLYNHTMKELGQEDKMISASAIKAVRREGLELLTHLSGSQGKAGIKKIMMYRDRFRPSSALAFVSLDGWDVELAYKDIIEYKTDTQKKVSRRTVYGLRHNVVVVSDACIDFPIGWYVSTHETSATIKAALRSTMRFIKSQFGDFYQIEQLKTDNFGTKNLKQSYSLVSNNYTPAAVGNSNDKPIEAWFRVLNNRCQMKHYNWTGYGNQAVTKHNTDITHNRQFQKMQPSKTENIAQIEEILKELQSEKLEVWKAMFDASKLNKMTNQDYLIALGEYRIGRDKKRATYRMGKRGIEVVRNGELFIYQTFETSFKKFALVHWELLEDPEDLQNVLAISPDGKLKYLLHRQEQSPMALSERTSKHTEYDKKIEQHNASIIKQVLGAHDDNYNGSLAIFEQLQAKGASTAQIEKLMPIIGGQQKTYQKIAQTKKAIEKSIPTPKEDYEDPTNAALNAF